MQIQKGLVKYKDRSDIVCTYGITDEGTQYYFLDGNNLPNGYIIASTALVEAIDPMVECSAIGVINQDGRMIIPFENKSIKVISNDMLLVERAVPLNPTVLEAIQLRSDPLAATRLVTTPAAIKDKINASMGVEGRFIFNDQFSEATIYDINGNNLFNNEYYSFIAMTKNKLYFSKNTAESPVMELTFSNVVEETPTEEVPTIPKLDIETTSVSREEIEDAINSKSEVITDSNDSVSVENNNSVEEVNDSFLENNSVQETDTVNNEKMNINVVSNDVVDSALSGNAESSDNVINIPVNDITAETVEADSKENDEVDTPDDSLEDAIEEHTDDIESDEKQEYSEDEKETEEDSEENGIEDKKIEKDNFDESDDIKDSDDSEKETEEDFEDNNDIEDKKIEKDNFDESDDIKDSEDEKETEKDFEKEDTTGENNSSEEEKQELRINVDDSENDDFDINFNGINLDDQVEVEDNKNKFNEFSADSINFDDDLDSDYEDSLFGGINTDNLLDDMDDGLGFNSMLKKDKIIVDNYDIDYRPNGVVKDTIIEDVASTMTNLIKSNRNQKKRIEMCESHINQLNTAGKRLLQKTKSQSREIDSLKNKIKSYEAMISKLESRNQVLDSKVDEQEKIIVSQTNELDMLRPQVEGKKDLVRLIEDAQSLLSQDK